LHHKLSLSALRLALIDSSECFTHSLPLEKGIKRRLITKVIKIIRFRLKGPKEENRGENKNKWGKTRALKGAGTGMSSEKVESTREF
jgi:hypothetical protein